MAISGTESTDCVASISAQFQPITAPVRRTIASHEKTGLDCGGGIGGLAAALASSHAGWDVRLFERAPLFSEVGAGVQLGPNVVRRLQAWGLQRALVDVAAIPARLRVRSA
jgi:heterodisulfide reductase subunit A-like polyferredoxin